VCDLEVIGAPSIFRVMSSAGDSVRMLPTFDLSCEENTTVVELVTVRFRKLETELLKLKDHPTSDRVAFE